MPSLLAPATAPRVSEPAGDEPEALARAQAKLQASCHEFGDPSPLELTSQRLARGTMFPMTAGNPKKPLLFGPHKPRNRLTYFCAVALK